jgi:hypothetical protein
MEEDERKSCALVIVGQPNALRVEKHKFILCEKADGWVVALPCAGIKGRIGDGDESRLR